MQLIARSIALAYNNLPRPHRLMLGSLTIITLAIAVWRPVAHHDSEDDYPEKSIVKKIQLDSQQASSSLPEQANSLLPEASEPLDQPPPAADIPQDELDDKTDNEQGIHEYVVSTGDTLSSILNQFGIDMADISALAAQNSELRSLKVGQQLSWTVNDEGELQRLTWEKSRRETATYDRTDQGFKASMQTMAGEWQDQVLKGTLDGSFVSSAKEAGLTNAEIGAVVKALQWQLDFKKLRQGDQFSVLMSREVLNGKNEQSQLAGVRLRSGGRDYYAIRAEDGKFYDRAGSGLARGFLRFPTLRQYRVSSNFNPRRLNPVSGRIAPHRGVDFAVPMRTPVLAVGDGEVVVVNNGGNAGTYVALRHGRQYTTRYMHLSKALVKTGQKVKRGERIALSGNSGRSTGPHLHYEIWINNVAVNPLTAKMPRSEGLNGSDLKQYLATVRQIMPQLTL